MFFSLSALLLFIFNLQRFAQPSKEHVLTAQVTMEKCDGGLLFTEGEEKILF
jgi:hypothetical protein